MRACGGLGSPWQAWHLVAAVRGGCGSDDQRSTAARPAARPKVGEGEGEVDLIAWAGYVEDGSTDRRSTGSADFEKQTGCKVNVKIGNTSDEMVQLMSTGEYDGVSASGDATLRLIAAATSPRSTPTWCPTTPTSSRA